MPILTLAQSKCWQETLSQVFQSIYSLFLQYNNVTVQLTKNLPKFTQKSFTGQIQVFRGNTTRTKENQYRLYSNYLLGVPAEPEISLEGLSSKYFGVRLGWVGPQCFLTSVLKGNWCIQHGNSVGSTQVYTAKHTKVCLQEPIL